MNETTRSDLSSRLRARAQRLRACIPMIYEPKWREIFLMTAILFEETAAEIDSLHSELYWAHALRVDAQAQLKTLQEQIAAEHGNTH